MFIGPAPSHAAHHRQGILRSGATVLATLRFAHSQLRMPTALPMDRQDHITHRIVDINDNVGNQSTEQLLAHAHGHIGRIPGRL